MVFVERERLVRVGMLFCRPKKKTKKEKKENRHRTISCGVRFCWAPEMPRSYFLLAFFLLLLLLLCFCVSVVSLCALLLFRSCLCRCSFPSSPTASPIASPIASPSASPFAPPPFLVLHCETASTLLWKWLLKRLVRWWRRSQASKDSVPRCVCRT